MLALDGTYTMMRPTLLSRHRVRLLTPEGATAYPALHGRIGRTCRTHNVWDDLTM